VDIYYQNGPFIVPKDKNIEVLETYDGEDSAAIVLSKYGKGWVLIFSPHPEGMSLFSVNPEKIGTLKLLKSSIDFITKK
jgi:glutamine amidotransferase-like uncharacterized protein